MIGKRAAGGLLCGTTGCSRDRGEVSSESRRVEVVVEAGGWRNGSEECN